MKFQPPTIRRWSQEKLDEADPRVLPFWYWFLHELFDLIGTLVSGFFAAIFFLIATGVVLGILANQYPQWTFSVFKNAVCNTQ